MWLFWKTLKNPIKLLFLTALVATLGFTLSSQLPQQVPYSDDATRLIVSELQEANSDSEQLPQLDDVTGILVATRQLQFGGNLNPHHLFFSEFAPRLAFLYHIRPRSPPQSQIS